METTAPPSTGTRTIARLWQDAVSAKRSTPAYLVERDGEWSEVSWAEAAEAVDELAHGLLAIGIRKGDSFAILGSTTLEWALFDFALASIGAVGAPIYANSSPGDCAHVLENSDAVGILVEDEAQRAKIADVPLEHVYSFADLDGLRARGREHAAEHPRAVEEAAAAIDPEDLFTFIYTSGTTGPPKGCMIRHRNYYAMCQEAEAANDVLATEDVLLLFLPLAHNFGRLVHLLGPYLGFTIAFCPDPLKVAEALPIVRPTVFPSVPRLYEKIHTGVTAAFEAETGAKRKIVDWALRVGKRVSQLRQAGQPIPARLRAQHRLADKLVYSKVKARLGGRLRVGISGGAPLAKEILEFFHMLDILILEGYGLTECTTAATVNRMNRFRFGTVGLPYDGVELKLADDGEVLIRTDTVFGGYYKDEEATREVLGDDGWLRSGDIGSIDDDGFLTITDRKKDILVTAGGKNVAPQNLENALKSSRHVSQALVVGDRRPYVAALITLDETEERAGDAQALIQGVVDGVNAKLSRFEQIKRFTILPRDFSAELGEVTPTLKLKRRVCEQHFADEIDALYQ
ncbi:MAG: long-chain acyl-CoA synthetase [Gaiellaceae bacterium]|nr:long-chain acyl-CoA synthetase [Gaiellaceae bacterium]